MSAHGELRELFASHGQDQVFANWDALPPEGREELLRDCAGVDFAWIEARREEFSRGAGKFDAAGIEPAPVARLAAVEADRRRSAAAVKIGEEKLRRGKAAAFLAAGGQGSRLGFDGPKGCFPIGPISGKTLFQWHAERILANSRRHGAAIPWYIMTSRDNDSATRAYFRDNGFFGLREGDVFFFSQEMVPSLDFQGKLLLASPSRLALNPNGHGGSLSGLVRSGALADMERRGIEIISYFQVDNPLVAICDPLFIGAHIMAEAEMSSKALRKNAPEEKIGVMALRDGKHLVIEYSDMDEASMRAVGPDGGLKFWAGSIAIHLLNVDFVKAVGGQSRLPWHQARKKVPYFANGALVRPERENAVKFETFVFDAIPLAKRSVNLEVAREQEFAPVKNAEGIDSPVSCRRLLSSYFAAWLAGCGVAAPAGAAPLVEISPLYSLDAGELAGKIKPGGLKLENALLLG
ncbi:MAG: UTP--glucose-1-phosphate uridylyltransferase [Planctomycetota bacterium]|nr:UTP--glucose-1-phosphate uridylyltransferase [Planctomycetota bacterium]